MRYWTPNFPTLKTDFYHIDITPATKRATNGKITIIPALTRDYVV